MKRVLTAWPIVLVSLFAFAGCGGEDDEPREEETTSAADADASSSPSEGASPAATVDHEAVLACIQGAGIDAKDQFDEPPRIGIDYAEGRTTINFEETEEDAELTERLAQDYSVEVDRFGTVVVGYADTDEAYADAEKIEACIVG